MHHSPWVLFFCLFSKEILCAELSCVFCSRSAAPLKTKIVLHRGSGGWRGARYIWAALFAFACRRALASEREPGLLWVFKHREKRFLIGLFCPPGVG